MSTDAPSAAHVRLGYALGALGVLIFAVTIPMTRLATGTVDAPQLSPEFVTLGRAALAGLLSVAWLLLTGAARPQRAHWRTLLICAGGVVIGFPLFMSLAVRQVLAVHAAVIVGVLPLVTAVVGAIWLRQRPSRGFWVCAVAGCLLVLAYAGLRGGGAMHAADGLLLIAVLSAAIGYVGGARLTTQGLSAEQVICWILVLGLPLTLPGTAWLTLTQWPSLVAATPAAWAGFVYVAIGSMWLGFFAWYRGLALGGTLRVSQVQLLQPFLTLLAAVPILGESIDTMTLLFALAVIATVFIGRRMPVHATA